MVRFCTQLSKYVITSLCHTHNVYIFLTHTVVDCGVPNHPGDGDVTFSLTVFNALAFYTCDNGYNLFPSESVRTCEANGLWSGDDRICQRKSTKQSHLHMYVCQICLSFTSITLLILPGLQPSLPSGPNSHTPHTIPLLPSLPFSC